MPSTKIGGGYMSEEEIHAVDFKAVEMDPDAGGAGVQWNCSKCGTQIRWAPYMWWDMTCECGSWDFPAPKFDPGSGPEPD
jgi:hypothetical protein